MPRNFKNDDILGSLTFNKNHPSVTLSGTETDVGSTGVRWPFFSPNLKTGKGNKLRPYILVDIPLANYNLKVPEQ